MLIIKTRIKREEKRTIYTIIAILSGIGSVYHVNITCVNIYPNAHLTHANCNNIQWKPTANVSSILEITSLNIFFNAVRVKQSKVKSTKLAPFLLLFVFMWVHICACVSQRLTLTFERPARTFIHQVISSLLLVFGIVEYFLTLTSFITYSYFHYTMNENNKLLVRMCVSICRSMWLFLCWFGGLGMSTTSVIVQRLTSFCFARFSLAWSYRDHLRGLPASISPGLDLQLCITTSNFSGSFMRISRFHTCRVNTLFSDPSPSFSHGLQRV